MRLRKARLKAIASVAVIVVLISAFADWTVREFAYRFWLSSTDLTVAQIAQRWDEFFEFAGRIVIFQQTFNIYKPLLDPSQRTRWLQNHSDWLEEIRKSARADFWVVIDAKGKTVVSLPWESENFSLRRIWQTNFNHYPCKAAVFASDRKKPTFIGIGTEIAIDYRKRGELWLLYGLESLAQKFSDAKLPISFGLATVKGNFVVQLGQSKFKDLGETVDFASKLNKLPLLLIASVPKNALWGDVGALRFFVLVTILLAAVAAVKFSKIFRGTSGNELAVKLTEIFHTLSQRFLETHNTEEVFQALAETIVREFRFALAVVFRFEKQTQNYIAAGYAPFHVLNLLLSQSETVSNEKPTLIFPKSLIEKLSDGSACAEKICIKAFTSLLPNEVRRAFQLSLRLKNEWCALLFAEGRPIGAILVGTSREQFSEEELQALELVRQQTAMLLTMVLNCEEQSEAEKQKSRFLKILLSLTKELPQKQSLAAKLQLIAQVAQGALEVSRVSVWQIIPDRQYAYCLAAFGDSSEELVGKALPTSRYFAYLASLEKERVIAINSVSDDLRAGELKTDYWHSHGIIATMDSPVRIEGRVVGIVCCEHKANREWSSDEVTFAGEISNLVAQVILEWQHQRRERYLSTLSQIALQMLVATEWERVLPVFLEDMGKEAEADRVFAAQLFTDEQGNEFLRCLSVWSADGVEVQERDCPLHQVATPDQIAAMERGESVFCLVETSPEPYRKFYENRGVKAVLAVPIFVESRWWGILGFSDRRMQHYWDEVDIAILRVAASLLGSAIERQKAAESQLDRERQFRELVENATVGIYRSTPQGRLLLANSALAQMLGYESPEEAIASITDLAQQVYADPSHREDFKRMIAEHGFVKNFIVPLKRRNQETFWAAVSGRAVYSSDGKLLYYEGFVLDITARKKAEEQLQRRIEQLQALNRLSSVVQESNNFSQIAEETLRCLKAMFKGDKIAVALIEDDGKPKIKASDGISERLRQAIEDALACSEIGFATSPILVEDLKAATSLGHLREIFLEEGIRSILCAPIMVQDRVLGRLSVYFSQPRKFERDEEGFIHTIAHQISFAIARKIAEEQLRRSEREFRSIFENAVVGIYRSTPDGRFLMANETLARVNGYDSVDELMTLDIPSQIYLNPEDRERFKRLMAEKGFVANYRYPIKRKDGSVGWVAKWARAVKDEKSNLLYYEGFVLDITEQVQIEQRLHALQETARLLVMRLDVDSIIQVAINSISQLYPDSAVLIFQYREDSDSFALENSNESARDLMKVLGLETGNNLKRRSFPILEDKIWSGENILVNDISSAVGSSAQKLTQLGYRAIFFRGIGNSSQLWGLIAIFKKGEPFSEPDMVFLNSFCDYLSIAIRNATLFQQVQQAYEEMKAIQERMIEQERLKALGQIASGIAHDINNALVPIQGFAEILLEHSDPVVRDAAEMIFKSASDITATVQRMREFYRTRSGEDLLEPFNLNEICKDALRMTKPRWFNMPMERGIVIETRLELSNDLPPLMGIPSEIRQAIVNLIINAVDAMPEGGILTIRTYKHYKGGRAWAVVEVSDTGIGMDEETKRRAIEPFFTTKGERGSGLGLAAVYGTVQRHEGFMDIDSELGKGTTVRLWLPSNVVQPVELLPEEVPSLKLLVIDDEPSVRETLTLLLRKDGHIVATASDGEEGFDFFQRAYLQGNPFNVVITDLGMPKVDGISFAKKVKEVSPETPVILLTGWGFRIRSEEVKNIVDLVLTKPANYQQIRRALNQVWLSRIGR